MKRFILTGAPGAGKTSILHCLARAGTSIVEEAATEVIAREHGRGVAEPWLQPRFIDLITELQIERIAAATNARLQFHDRSAACTLALARWLGHPVSPRLEAEVERLRAKKVFEPVVFFIQDLGFVEKTSARRMGFEESVAFGRLHEETYRELGYNLVMVPRGPIADRARLVMSYALERAQTESPAAARSVVDHAAISK